MMTAPSPEAPTAWVAYVQVERIEDSVRKVGQLGGHVMMDRTPVPGHGYFAIVGDPTGGVIGLWEDDEAAGS